MEFGLSESVAHWGRYRRRRTAIIANRSRVSYEELNRRVDAVVPALVVESAERVAVACGSKLELLVALLAVIRAGKSVVLLNPGLSDESLDTNLTDAAVGVLLHSSAEKVAGLVQRRGGRLIDMATIQSNAVATPLPTRKPDAEWGVLYSSGTTGVPKGIVRDHDSMVTEFLGWILELGLNRDTTFFIGRPIYYTGGLVLAGATLVVGGTIVLDDLEKENDHDQNWGSLTATLRDQELDWAFFIPEQVRAILQARQSLNSPHRLGNLLVMGGPISGGEKVAASQLLGCGVIESWGNTESLGTITEREDLDVRPNSIGRPFLCDDLSIVDSELRTLPSGNQGRIAGSVDAGFLQYTNRPEATQNARRDGLIISEDFGYQDDDGYFYILGRASDHVLRAGRSIFLSQIEARIRTADHVRECCVTAVGDENGIQIVAVVSPSDDCDTEALRASLNALLAEHEQIDRVLDMKVPKLPNGKLNRLACKKLAEDACATAGRNHLPL